MIYLLGVVFVVWLVSTYLAFRIGAFWLIDRTLRVVRARRAPGPWRAAVAAS